MILKRNAVGFGKQYAYNWGR